MKSSFPLIVPGAKVKFNEEKQRYTVICRNERFAICTKPFNCRRTVLYCILDFDRNVRGPDDLIFSNFGYKSKRACMDALRTLERGEMQVSYRHCLLIQIDRIDPPRK